MPNRRAPGIVNASFTMPASMVEKLEARARMEMTNKSEIVRRAIMSFLTEAERDQIMKTIMNDAPNADAPVSKGRVNYSNQKKPIG